MATKKKLTIQEIDWENHLKRLRNGFRNRFEERRADHPKRKWNCRKPTIGRMKYRHAYLFGE